MFPQGILLRRPDTLLKPLVRLGILTVLLFALIDCNKPEGRLRIGSNVFPGYEFLYLARDLGYYQDKSIFMVELTSASEVLHAFRNGNLEGAALTLDETLVLLEEGLELYVVLVFDYSNGADVLLAKPHIKNLQQLKNKKIAVETTAVGAILLEEALSSAELTSTDVQLSNCKIDEHESCFKNVDAIVTFEPVKSRLMSKGAVNLFDSSRIPGRIVDVLVVTKTAVESRQRRLRDLIDGYFKARRFFRKKPKEAARIMSKRLHLTTDETLKAFEDLHLLTLDENREMLSGKNPKVDELAKKLGIFMQSKFLLKKIPRHVDLSRESFLPDK